MQRPTPRATPALAPEVEEIPIGVRRAAAWSWRLIVVVAALAVLLWAASKIGVILIPVLVAILLTAMLAPIVRVLAEHTFLNRAAASGIALIGTLILVAGMFTLAGRQLAAQFEDIQRQAVAGFTKLTTFATDTLQISTPTIDAGLQQLVDKLEQNSGAIASGALSGVATLGNVLTGILICLFTLFFLLSGGSGVWRWCVGLLPPSARVPTHEAFRRGWKALSAYVRTQILVAAVDATGIAIGIIALGLGSYAVPIWLIVFLFSFIPLVGAIVSGAIAVLIVLVLKSWVMALVMLGVVILVQQVEGNVLQPFLMGKAVELHPLAVFLGVAVGSVIAGIPGALFAIPLIAFVNATLLYLTGRDPSPELGTEKDVAASFRRRRGSARPDELEGRGRAANALAARARSLRVLPTHASGARAAATAESSSPRPAGSSRAH